MKSARAFALIELFVVVVLLLMLAGLLWLSAGSTLSMSKKTTIGKNDAVQIANAIRAFETEYGKFPTSANSDITTNVSGELLAALTSSNSKLNPRGMIFIETSPWKNGKGGIRDGAWIDPWGNPFRVSMDVSGDTNVVVSLTGESTGTNIINKRVAVWNMDTNPKQQVHSWHKL